MYNNFFVNFEVFKKVINNLIQKVLKITFFYQVQQKVIAKCVKKKKCRNIIIS